MYHRARKVAQELRKARAQPANCHASDNTAQMLRSRTREAGDVRRHYASGAYRSGYCANGATSPRTSWSCCTTFRSRENRQRRSYLLSSTRNIAAVRMEAGKNQTCCVLSRKWLNRIWKRQTPAIHQRGWVNSAFLPPRSTSRWKVKE